jgi:anti-anti-sigma factor
MWRGRSDESGRPGNRCEGRRLVCKDDNDVRLDLADGQAPTVVVKGEIDGSTAPRLRSCLAAAGAAAPDEVVVDMAGLTFIDSANLGVLATAQQELAGRGGHLVITNAPPAALMVLRLTGLEQMLILRSCAPGDGTPVGG